MRSLIYQTYVLLFLSIVFLTTSSKLESKPINDSEFKIIETKNLSNIIVQNVKQKKAVKKSKGQKYINKGIDISGRLGEPIYAAAAGEVVYAGSGLLGYGNLVIINHNETYLSAYAHNRKILVQEGQPIKIGQKIAEMGRSETSKPMLHFEIRKNGEPVDPMRFLPSR